ncbi:MAG: hypothetical protein Q9201_003276 [Fulgogasparrea decipioides]
MDPLAIGSVIGSIVLLVDSSFKTTRYILSKRYGLLERATLALLLPSIFIPEKYKQVEKFILNGRDEDTLVFRQAITDECNMTAVAGAIIAQVAITGLSLPNLSSTHWVARACLILAVTSGSLTVYYCCVLQRAISKLYRPELVRNWLGYSLGKGLNAESPRVISVAAMLIVSAPFTMLKVSVFSFLVGLAIYLGFTWTRALDTDAGPGDSRDVFITFMVGTGLCLLVFSYTYWLKYLEDVVRTLKRSSANQEATVPAQAWDDNAIPPLVDSSAHLRHSVGKESAEQDLSAALQAAARAHLQCAEAESKVALEYSRASRTKYNNKEEGGLPQNERSEPGP